MEEQSGKTEKAEILLKNLSAYISTMSFWVFAFVWNYLFEELEFVPRLGLGAALSWVVFLHVEAIGMIIMSMMREKLQSEAEARVRAQMRAQMEEQMEERIVARIEARMEARAAREAQTEAREALAREAQAQETIRDLRATTQRGARRRRERRRRRLDTGRPRDSRRPKERLSHAQSVARLSRYATAPDARSAKPRADA